MSRLASAWPSSPPHRQRASHHRSDLQRIKKQSKDRIKNNIVACIYNKCILGKDTTTIATAKEIMKKEIGLSYRPFRAILIAEIINSNRFLKRIFPLIINWYLQAKDKIVLFKKRKKYIDVKTYANKCELPQNRT